MTESLPALLEKVDALGLFDDRWYSDTYNLFFATRLEAFADYIRKSRHSNVDPSPLFSSKSYYKAHFRDVLEKKVSPLEHYIEFSKPGKSYQGQRNWIPSSFLESNNPYANTLKCAITAHIFYEDYLPKLAECISGFPHAVDAYLIVPSEEISKQATKIIQNVDCIREVFVHIAPNKGRNFGPLLVAFGKSLMHYDLFCHVHSKKSLFTGSSQDLWGDYLYEYLLQDKQIVNKVLSLFENNPSLGLYYPTQYDRSLPRWASHSLKNRQSLDSLAKLLNLNPIDNGFFAYPVGGMFWARPEALSKLLLHDWAYNNFPDEPIPNDGTILHAIERILPCISIGSGFSEFFYHPPSGKFTTDNLHIFEGYAGNQADLDYISFGHPCKVVSYDLFDTLFSRTTCYPDYAKLRVGQILGFDNPEDFVKLRNYIEFSIRKRKDFKGDVSLLEIYNELSAELKQNIDPKESSDLEFNCDLETLLPRPLIVDHLKRCQAGSKEVWIITDTYYSYEHVQRILMRAGIILDRANVHISSELGLRKDNGSMWNHIKQVLLGRRLNPSADFIHIGDNVVSDCQVSGDHGLPSCHVLHPIDKYNYVSKQAVSHSMFEELDNRLRLAPIVSTIGLNPFI